MIVLPAIDLRNGRVVRLKQGRADAETKYGDDPAQMARRWQDQGAEWLHVVNLDGAFGDDSSANRRELARIVAAVAVPVQFGGGLRDLAAIDAAFQAGVSRAVIGTGALTNPSLVSDAAARYGSETIVVGIDARDGFVATHGWQALSSISAVDLANQVAGRGVTRIVFTDIARDGMMSGAGIEATAEFARATGLHVIAAGGVASLNDIQALAKYERDGIEGVIVGQALYTGAFSLAEAIRAGRPAAARGEHQE